MKRLYAKKILVVLLFIGLFAMVTWLARHKIREKFVLATSFKPYTKKYTDTTLIPAQLSYLTLPESTNYPQYKHDADSVYRGIMGSPYRASLIGKYIDNSNQAESLFIWRTIGTGSFTRKQILADALWFSPGSNILTDTNTTPIIPKPESESTVTLTRIWLANYNPTINFTVTRLTVNGVEYKTNVGANYPDYDLNDVVSYNIPLITPTLEPTVTYRSAKRTEREALFALESKTIMDITEGFTYGTFDAERYIQMYPNSTSGVPLTLETAKKDFANEIGVSNRLGFVKEYPANGGLWSDEGYLKGNPDVKAAVDNKVQWSTGTITGIMHFKAKVTDNRPIGIKTI